MNQTPSPKTVAKHVTAGARQQNEQRRQHAARNGYRGPLTRAELAALVARRESQH